MVRGWRTAVAPEHESRRRLLGQCRGRELFATLTKELLGDQVFASREEATRRLVEFIEIWYNRQRRHSTLGSRTPVKYEEMLRAG